MVTCLTLRISIPKCYGVYVYKIKTYCIIIIQGCIYIDFLSNMKDGILTLWYLYLDNYYIHMFHCYRHLHQNILDHSLLQHSTGYTNI